MPEYLAPGVYVEEIDTGSKPIEGVSTSTAGMIGVTERGPVNVPTLITSFGEFRRWFGDHLGDVEFTNTFGYHCYLPAAVEGFFTNGGKRVYVTRILRPDAAASTLSLFDRGGPASVSSVLLRTAAEGTGTPVHMPLVSVLAPGTLAATDWIRIGDGSQAEYHEVVSVRASTHVPLNFPLDYAHDAGVTIRQFAHALATAPAFGAGFTLQTAGAAESTTIVVTGAAADLTLLTGLTDPILLATPLFVEIGAPGHGEYHRVVHVAGTGTSRTLTLDRPLVQRYAVAEPVLPLLLTAAPVDTTTLAAAANAGDQLLFGVDLHTNFDDPTTLVIVDPTGARAEVRRIGDLRQLTLATGAAMAYPRNARVEQVDIVDDDRIIPAGVPAVPAMTVVLDTVDGLAVGQGLVVDPAAPDPVVIQSIDPVAKSVTFTASLAAAHVPANTPVRVVAKQLTAAAPAGSVSLPLDNRLGLVAGDVLRVGTAATEEFVTIGAVPGGGAAAPDAGIVVLLAPTTRPHALGAQVRRQLVRAAAGAHHPAYVTLPVAPGATTLVVNTNDAFVASTLVRVQLATVAFYHRLGGSAAVAPQEVELHEELIRNHEAGAAVAERVAMIDVQALDPGSWGDRLRVTIEDEPNGLVTGATLATVNSPTSIVLSSPNGVEPGTVLELSNAVTGAPILPLLKVVSINRSNNRITLAAPLNFLQSAAAGAPVRSREFRLSVLRMRRPDPTTPSRDDAVIGSERFNNLSMDPRHSRYFATVIGDINGPIRLSDRRPEGSSDYIRVHDLETVATNQQAVRLGPEALIDILPNGRPRAARHALSGGDDAITLLNDAVYIGTDAPDPEARTGLQTLRNVEEISIVSCPGRTGTDIQGALISHCEEMRYRFAVLDGPRPPNDAIADVRALRQQFDTKYAALYHPWLLVPPPYPTTPAPGQLYQVPPSGHVVGIYARTDIERGVHKSPANEVVRGILGLQRALNKGEHDILNPYPVNINVIRDFRPNNRGIRVWGGRVITSDSDWKYVNVRRLLIFIEASIDRGLQWVVFEPNAEPLWARVRRSISNFLRVVWRNGALEGTKVEEAFFVKCDRTTMTQTDIDSGRLICVIGVAPVKPAEFVIIQIGLWTAHADS